MSAGAFWRSSALAMLLALGACGSDRTEVVNRLVPLDRELADLQRARERGIISDEEYADQRARLIEADRRRR